MAFVRKEAAVQAIDLHTLNAAQIERRIIDGVRKYANKAENWANADKNTSFLGTIIGMGIESANLVDITMSIEKQFLTNKTRRVPVEPGSSSYRLEDGELGRLVIAEGQDTFAATPGLAVRMLMELGHVPADAAYLQDLVSFAYVVVIGEGYRLNNLVRKQLAKIEKASEAQVRVELTQNLKAQVEQLREFISLTADPKVLMRSRELAFDKEREGHEALASEVSALAAQMKQLAPDATVELDALKAKQVALRLRMGRTALMVRITEQVAKDCGTRNATEEAKVQEIRKIMETTLAMADAIA